MKLPQKVEFWFFFVPEVVITTVVVAIGAMCEIWATWWIFELCTSVAACLLVLAQHSCPMKHMVLPDSDRIAQPGAVSCNPGKDGCWECKHPRQMAAFRRSKRG